MSLDITRRERAAMEADPASRKTLTKQEFAKESDINTIIKGFERTGLVPVANLERAFADVSQVGSFDEALRLVTEAKQAFMQLDPKLRSRFQNDPQQLLAFLENADNYDEAVKLGLIVKKEAPPTPKEPPKAPPAPPA